MRYDTNDIEYDKPINRLFGDLSDIKQNVGIVATEISWIKKSINALNEKMETCKACSGSDFLYSRAENNKERIDTLDKKVENVKEDVHNIKTTAMTVMKVFGVVVVIIGVYVSLNQLF